jgi:predicted HicB family RNase H-like nuclease
MPARKVQVLYRIDPALRRRINTEAAKQNRSASNLVETILAEHLPAAKATR